MYSSKSPSATITIRKPEEKCLVFYQLLWDPKRKHFLISQIPDFMDHQLQKSKFLKHITKFVIYRLKASTHAIFHSAVVYASYQLPTWYVFAAKNLDFCRLYAKCLLQLFVNYFIAVTIFVVTSCRIVLNIKVVLAVATSIAYSPVVLYLQLSRCFNFGSFMGICSILFWKPAYISFFRKLCHEKDACFIDTYKINIVIND